MKRLHLIALLVVLGLMVTLAACGGGAAPAEAPAEEAPAAEAPAEEAAAEEAPAAEAPAAGEVVELAFWHAMGGDLGEVVAELTQRFNDSQDGLKLALSLISSRTSTWPRRPCSTRVV
jgi:ABC-type glycerol-3-phosphate transport system substrate-binding protein